MIVTELISVKKIKPALVNFFFFSVNIDVFVQKEYILWIQF